MENQYDLMEQVEKLARTARRRRGLEGGVSRGGLRLLRIVCKNPGVRTSELAQRLDIRPSSLTDALNRLEKDGYITREKDESDKRVLRVCATEKAESQFAELNRQRQQQSQRLLACLSEEEAGLFCALCARLCAQLEQVPDTGPAVEETR